MTSDISTIDHNAIWHPYTRRSSCEGNQLPVICRGDGPYLYDTEGVRYLDAISSWWACNLGHSHPTILEAIQEQAARLQHSILGNLSHRPAMDLADALRKLLPASDRVVMYASDGSSAVEAALKIALQHRHNQGEHDRVELVSLENAYHGDTLGAVSVGYQEGFHQPFKSVLFPVHRAESPCCSRCGHGTTPEQCDLECFGSMKSIFEENSTKLAAVIVESMCQGAAGMRIYSPRYLRALSDLCREHNVLLIADEIAMGMGRTGKMFAFEHAGVDPDIVCLGKGLSGGYLPLSATIAKRSIYDSFSDAAEDHTFYHGHTFGGNPIACAAALATLDIYTKDSIVDHAKRLGEHLSHEMNALAQLPGVTGVRCLGMIGALETEDPQATRERMLERHKILIRPLGNTVYLMLPLNADEALVTETVASLGDCL
jgi:adenosylmethionine-8-amino-7-oxononanoate aminotransferase